MSCVALVTGANTGIGWAIAKRLQRDGFAVGFHSRDDREESRERFDEISKCGRAYWLRGDLGEPDIAERLIAETVETLGGIDALINNAGITVSKPVLELGAEDFDRIFSVDVRGAFLMAVAAARRMREAGRGVIVNITSVHEHVPRPGFALYAPAKAALGMITRSLALELGAEGIRVVSVAPGTIRTARNKDADKDADEIPLGRAGEPEDVAALVAWVISDEARYVTGASLLVDGGFILHGVGS
jgi:NAD(P)-dependent dehydrogenase (short-subunit alcohol dehydrogenase family)